MVGADRVAAGLGHRVGGRATTTGAGAQRAEIRLSPGSPPFDVSIYAGERVGVAGLDGNGQEKFLRVLACWNSPPREVVSRDTTGRTRLRSFARPPSTASSTCP